ncbi:hypothetical protein Ahy_B09g096875 isoform G [Arachis hypogaea]|uniref:Uncharacterized protein n=1 Tax=Arachis hypogaea TaxID=3818 RepID=A0A444XMP6_ARAHY|nr:hypothetical protein Ahy_B09g096875 isoform G [Arachis hypogaea]
MGSSFPCQICVVGFLCGVCLTSLFLAALTSFGTFQLGPISFSSTMLFSVAASDSSSSSAWNAELTKSKTGGGGNYLMKDGVNVPDIPNAPHLENCKAKTKLYGRLDQRTGNESFPPWTSWKGFLDTHPVASSIEQIKELKYQAVSEGTYPPWIAGSDEENYPMTRKFLVADWERLPGFGIGAQIAGMCGLLAIAISEGRVLVANYYNRADHDGCKGIYLFASSRSSWSCYFFPETSQECRQRAFELMKSEEARNNGIVTIKESYTSKHIWSYLQPTTDVNGSLLVSHRKMDRRWWRAQAVRYLMRFPTEYTCNLLNEARHAAFGTIAAKMVIESLAGGWPKQSGEKERSEINEYVWSNHKPWIPRPLLSMHVRMGDKACEMKVVEFEGYMELADRIRRHFPNLNNIWLSTEMQVYYATFIAYLLISPLIFLYIFTYSFFLCHSKILEDIVCLDLELLIFEYNVSSFLSFFFFFSKAYNLFSYE